MASSEPSIAKAKQYLIGFAQRLGIGRQLPDEAVSTIEEIIWTRHSDMGGPRPRTVNRAEIIYA
jgi:hypothetical protein